MEKDHSEPRPPAVEPTLEVGLHRCPFCHEAVAVDDGAWVGCASCLARHHAACWDGGRVCGACKHPTRLVPEGKSGQRGSLVTVAVVAVVACAFALTGVLLARSRGTPSAEELNQLQANYEERLQLERLKARDEAEAVSLQRTERRRAHDVELEREAALRREEEAARQREQEARAKSAPAPAAYTLDLVVRGLPVDGAGVIYALSPRGGHDGSRTRVTGTLAGGRALVPGYSTAGPVSLTLEWDLDGVHLLRYWPLEAASDRLELEFPLDGDATVRGRVAAGLTSVMAFGAVLSARRDVAPDGTFVLQGLPPGKYALVGYAGGHSPHSGAGGVVVELGPMAEVTLAAEVPRATPMR